MKTIMSLLNKLFPAPPKEHRKAFRLVHKCSNEHFFERTMDVCPSCGRMPASTISAAPVVVYWDDDPMGAGFDMYDIVRWELPTP
jgi:hypothetical protein